MKIHEIITETMAGAIGSVAVPMGGMQRRPNPSIYKKSKRKLKDGRIEDTFDTKTIDKHDKPQKKKSKEKDKVDESNPRREEAVKELVDKVKAKGLDQFRDYQGIIDRDAVESYMARNMPDNYRGRDTGKAIEDAMAELESALNEQVPYLQRSNSGYKKAVDDFKRLNPGKTEEDFKNLTYKAQEKYLNKYVEGKSPHKKGTKKYKKHMAAMHAG